MTAYAAQARAQGKHGAGELVAAVGLDAQLRQSRRWAGQARMSKRGNRYVRRAVMLAARSAALTDPQCRAICAAHRAKGNHYVVASSHVAHQLLHIAYSVLLHEKPYELPVRFTPAPPPELATAGT
jgi:transposase